MKQKLLLFTIIILSSFQGAAQPANTNISNGFLFDGEPYIAVNPLNSQNLVAAWMGIHNTGGLYRIAIKTRASFNGGTSWSATNTLPHFGTGYTSADVSMSFDKYGILYLSYIDSRQTNDSGGVYVSRSANGGLNWDTPTKAFDAYDVIGKMPIDRPFIAVDKSNTSNAGTLYITTKPAPWIAPPNRNYFKVSSDSGHTWTPIANVDGGNFLVGNYIAAPMAAPATTDDGKFLAVYPSYVASQNVLPALYLASSSDKGQTFTYTTLLAANLAPNDTNMKNGYQLITNPTDATKMMFLSPDSQNGDQDISAFHSNDGGQTWSSSVRVNDDAVANGKAQDMVWAAYNEVGNVIVTWRDRRNSATNGFWNSGYDFYYATSSDNGQTFSTNQKLSNQFISFDSILSQNGNDFMSCVYRGDTLYSVWGDTRNGKMNIYFAKTIVSTNTNAGTNLLDGEEPKWTFYPNPATEELSVSFSEINAKDVIEIYDETGRKINTLPVTSKTLKLNTGNLQSGLYFIKAKNEIRRFVKK